MSGSTARKVQPFTISTKLSLPKCSLEFAGDSCTGIPPLAALKKRDLHQSLNECVSLWAQTSLEPTGGRLKSTDPVEEMVTNDDSNNSSLLSRSIKKITLSNWHGKPSPGEERMFREPFHPRAEKNCNNNNCRTGKAQFKVFLNKEVKPEDAQSSQAADSSLTASSPATTHWKNNTISSTQSGRGAAAERRPCKENSTGLADLSKWSPLLTQFNCNIGQAENWVQGKLEDLKDGCRFQEWERVAQSLQRDMKDFENTMIKLNQMGEQLMVQPKSSTEIERRLQTLREQWQLLKSMAANQTKTVSGLKNLQEFNHKAEQLEAWIKQKKEKPLLSTLLQEKTDKIQLTRQILDLKEEELQFQAVREEMNSLARKLEKQGKSESKSIMARCKHLNKMWLQLQRTLKEHHETLQLALEVAAFLQQADVLLSSIHAKLRHLCGGRAQRESESSPDPDIRDIASQVMMLDVTVSQLISLHPSLAAQVSIKHQDIKASWAQLQQLLRSENHLLLALTKRLIDSSNPNQKVTTITKSKEQDVEENLEQEGRKDIPQIMAKSVRSQEGSSDFPGRENNISDSRSRKRKFLRQSNTLKDLPQQETHLQDICQAADGEMQHNLKWSPEMEDALVELGELWAELKKKHQENGMALQEINKALKCVGELEAADHWLETVTGLLSESKATKTLDDLRRDLQKIAALKNQARAWATKLGTLQEEMQIVSPSENTSATMIQKKMERVKEKLAYVEETLQCQASDLHDSLILMEFLQNVQVEQTLDQRSQVKTASKELTSQESLHIALAQEAQAWNSEDMRKPLKELQEAVEMLNSVVKERERTLKAVNEAESLECFTQTLQDKEEIRLTWLTSQIGTIRKRAETLAQDIIQVERSFALVKSELDLLEVRGLQKRQEEIESDMFQLEEKMEELERTVVHLKECNLFQGSEESRRILEIQEAWKDLQKQVLKNSVHGEQTVRLWQFFKDYLSIISWTEETRSQIFSEHLNMQGLSEAPWENLKNSMETKFREFGELAAAGWELVAEEHCLRETIKERMEELQNMLGWVMVQYQAQSFPKEPGNKASGRETQKGSLDVPPNSQIKIEVTEKNSMPSSSMSENGSEGRHHHKPLNEPAFTVPVPTQELHPECKHSFKALGNSLPFEVDGPKETLMPEVSGTPVLLVPQPAPGNLGGAVSLIFSFGKEGQKVAAGSQASASPEQETLHKILPSKLELQMMEGTLERKNLLQAGGRKANSRSWNTFHTVLMRQTLCFYQDKKDTFKQSSLVALPLNLSGAVCTLETEYTKKSNCFTLQLNDGSKFLLRAPTDPLMKEWITKLQHNSGLPEVDYFQPASQSSQGMASVVSAIPGQGVSHLQNVQQKLPVKSQETRLLPKTSLRVQLPYNLHSESAHTAASQTGNGLRSVPVYTAEQHLRQDSPLESTCSQDPHFCQEENCGLVTSKRRSYSFTSTTYQKVTPLSKSKEPLEAGGSYSITLYIGEQTATTPPRPRCHSFIATPSGTRETVKEQSQGTSLRQKNKSVFRKFFGKKD